MLPMQALAQTLPAPARTVPTPANDLGYIYRLPDDWQIVSPSAAHPPQQQEDEKTPGAELRKGLACVEVELTARHGDPPTVVVVVGLPFACYGETITEQELPGFGVGAAEGLKQTLEITNPITASYRLAGHQMWLQRARATPKGKTAPGYTVEIACTLLNKGAVCWMTQAADEPSLRIFERSPVTLDGDSFPALVPADTFEKVH